jgi:hypothetical protein
MRQHIYRHKQILKITKTRQTTRTRTNTHQQTQLIPIKHTTNQSITNRDNTRTRIFHDGRIIRLINPKLGRLCQRAAIYTPPHLVERIEISAFETLAAAKASDRAHGEHARGFRRFSWATRRRVIKHLLSTHFETA